MPGAASRYLVRGRPQQKEQLCLSSCLLRPSWVLLMGDIPSSNSIAREVCVKVAILNRMLVASLIRAVLLAGTSIPPMPGNSGKTRIGSKSASPNSVSSRLKAGTVGAQKKRPEAPKTAYFPGGAHPCTDS